MTRSTAMIRTLSALASTALFLGMTQPARAGDELSLDGSRASESRTQAFHGNQSVLGGPGYFTTAVGAGFSSGMQTDNTMFNLMAGYNIDYGPQITGKAFADLNLGMSADSSRFVDLAVGANFFPEQVQMSQIKPYLGADAGVGFVRNNLDRAADSLALGAAAGFQLLTQQTNIDVSMRYEILTEQIAGQNPQIFGLKVGMNY